MNRVLYSLIVDESKHLRLLLFDPPERNGRGVHLGLASSMASMRRTFGVAWERRDVTRFAIVLLAGLLAACGTLPGSGPTSDDFMAAPGPDKIGFRLIDLTAQSLAVLEARRPPGFKGTFNDGVPGEVQVLGAGDEVLVTIWEAGSGGLFAVPAFEIGSTGARAVTIPPQVVSRDGTVAVPFAGRVKAAGSTTRQIENAIIAGLIDKADNPQVLVTVTKSLTNTATVSGEVRTSALVPLSARNERLMDVIAMAGGPTAPPHELFVVLTRDGVSISVPMQVVLDRPYENIYIRPKDVITLLRRKQTFAAFGATGQNAVLPFEAPELSLDEAIARAGGLIDPRADPSGVFVIRYEAVDQARSVPAVFDSSTPLNGLIPVVYRIDMRDPNALLIARRFAMNDKDILYVSNAPMTEFQKLLAPLQTLIGTAASTTALGTN